MKNRLIFTSIINVFFLSIFMVIQGCSRDSTNALAGASSRPRLERPSVEGIIAKRLEKSWPIVVQGSVVAHRDAIVSARISGAIDEILIEEGDSVPFDAVLASMDVRELDAQRRQASANLQSMKAQLDKLRSGFQDEEIRQSASRLDSAQASYRRLLKDENRRDRLFRAGMIREADYEDYQTRLRVARADVDSASAAYRLALRGFRSEEIRQMEAQVDGAQAVVDLFDIRIGYGSIRSPLNGAIGKRLVDEGEWVSVGTPLFQIQSLDPIWVEAFVPEKDVADVKKGIRASLEIASFSGEDFMGIVDVVGVLLDLSTRSLPVKILVSNPKGLLKPGMFAHVILHPKSLPSLVIPKNAIFLEDDRTVATVVRDGRLTRLVVKTGKSDDECIEILSGLELGDRVVVSDVGGLSDGTEVDFCETAGISEPKLDAISG